MLFLAALSSYCMEIEESGDFQGSAQLDSGNYHAIDASMVHTTKFFIQMADLCSGASEEDINFHQMPL